MQVDTFILDFEKAFDTPPHKLLKCKSYSYGIGGKTLKWIDSFLCDRQQRVMVNGVKSDWAPVLSGVPQGTVLGPLSFSLYINDITKDIDSELRLFADDCVCYREIKDTEDTVKLQEDIDRLGCWARSWGMRFQPVKCNIMQITVNSDCPRKLNDCQDSKKDVSIVRERPMKCYLALIHMIQPAYQHRLSNQVTKENHKK